MAELVQVYFRIDADLLKDFDIASGLHLRKRNTHMQELMIAEVKRAVRKNPDAFKGE